MLSMAVGEVDVSVITPSLNMLGYLERCVASVADQEGARAEHLVMDGGSRDGTAEWLAARPWLVSEVRRDNGMYEAINRGFRQARGRILAHLNCDEQYLPGTLATVTRYFDTHPDVDVVFGDALIVRPDGSLIAYRKTVRPLWPVLSVPPLYVPSATTFFCRKLVDNGVLYDDSYKDIADLVRVVRLVKDGYRLAPRFLNDVPWWIRRSRRLWRLVGQAQKLLAGCYFQASPLEYAIYAPGQSMGRSIFVAHKPSYRLRWVW
jgi:glycosyltransferase involved in cell wall biosynthesis